jgi:hypothetical protein
MTEDLPKRLREIAKRRGVKEEADACDAAAKELERLRELTKGKTDRK